MPDMVSIFVNGSPVSVPEGSMVSAAVMMAGVSSFRRSVTGQPRGPLCGMGICFECRVTIDNQPHRKSCQIPVSDGMDVRTNE